MVLVNCARSIRAPTSLPVPAVLKLARTNVRERSTAVPKVAVVDSVAPVMVETVPRCTLMSAAVVNSITCHATMWLVATVVRN